MNIKTLKKYFLKKQIEKHLDKDISRAKRDVFKTVAILVNAEEFENTEAFTSLIKSLEIRNKDLRVITYKEEKRNLPTFEQNNFSSKDFSWNGILTKTAIEEFLDWEYDLFIGYYTKGNNYLDYITSVSKAYIKVGLNGADERLFDIIFKINIQKFALFERELAKYIRIFANKKETI